VVLASNRSGLGHEDTVLEHIPDRWRRKTEMEKTEVHQENDHSNGDEFV